jgi:hypothetical protein
LYYTPDVTAALRDVWELSGELCAELLHGSTQLYGTELMRAHTWKHSDEATGKLHAMSVGTMKNRITHFWKIRRTQNGIGTTKPSHIKFIVKVFTGPWSEKPFGYGQLDTVVHSGSSLSGDMAYTLNFTEVHSLWVGLRAQMNKGEEVTRESLAHVRDASLPFPMTGIHPDTGSEFLTWNMKSWCEHEGIDFTRSRAGEKNDNMLVEERNGHVVRKIIGYIRISCPEAVALLNELYEVECLIHNHFTPVRKTLSKEKRGARYRRTFDTPMSPYQRVLASKEVTDDVKRKLKKQHAALSLVTLRLRASILKKEVYAAQKRYGDRLW